MRPPRKEKKGHRKVDGWFLRQFCIGSGADCAAAGVCCWGVGGAAAGGAADGVDVGTEGAGVEGATNIFFNFFFPFITHY